MPIGCDEQHVHFIDPLPDGEDGSSGPLPDEDASVVQTPIAAAIGTPYWLVWAYKEIVPAPIERSAISLADRLDCPPANRTCSTSSYFEADYIP